MKQHTALRDCNYDLGSLFKGHKTLQLTENGDKIQTETNEICYSLYYFLEIIQSYA